LLKKKEHSKEHARIGSLESSHGKIGLGAVNGKVGRIEDQLHLRRGVAGALIHRKDKGQRKRQRTKKKIKDKEKDKGQRKDKRKDKYTISKGTRACMKAAGHFGA
jgi:hypothetical protein